MKRIFLGAFVCASLIAFTPANPRVKLLSGTFPAQKQTAQVRAAANRMNSPGDLSPLTANKARTQKEALAIRARKTLELPVIFEPGGGRMGPAAQFVGRGKGFSVLLGERDISLLVPEIGASGKFRRVQVGMEMAGAGTGGGESRQAEFFWAGREKLSGESNYFLGSDARKWRKHVPHYARILARDALPGVNAVAYGTARGVEYDLWVAPGKDAQGIRLEISGADAKRVDGAGDLLIEVAGRELRMGKPEVYETYPAIAGNGAQARRRRKNVSGGYQIERDGTVGFRVGRHDAGAELVLDPSISLVYDSFLGGAGDDEANSIAVDSSGNIYVAGTSTSPATFPEAGGTGLGPAGGSPDFFLAKINPAAAGFNSLVYLTFVGGSGSQNGGLIAVDAKGDVAMTGTTTSADYPVTDGSKLASGSSGANGAVVTQMDPTGAKLLYSTVLSGNGQEGTQNAGGIALGSAGEIFIASDTTTTNLCANAATTTPFQAANGGGGVTSDGFLALFNTSETPALRYCTYLGITAQVGVAGLAVDGDGNAFLAGFTSDPGGTFPSTAKGFQAAYAGGDFDGFLIKIAPSGNGAADLSYATYLGGSGADQIAAVAVGTALPATAYVTGVTESANFPVNGTNAAYQSTKKGAANAFLAVVTQNSSTGAASLAYSSYLGGTQTDAGLSVAVPAGNTNNISNQVYVAGVASSSAPDFPWLDNFQPLNGEQDAFVAKFDPTQSGASSLIYATPLGGTDLTANPVGAAPATSGNAVAADGLGHVYLAGTTSASDFPQAANAQNGIQVTCASCQATPAEPDAFVAEIAEGGTSEPCVSFNVEKIGFAAANVGASVPAVNAAVFNTGSAPLVISQMTIAGTNAVDFQLTGQGSCTSAPVAAGKFCTFSVGFSPSQVGPETATVVLADNAPVAGSTQVMDAEGRGNGPLAVASPGSLSFGVVQSGSKATLDFTISNAGNQTLDVGSVGSSNSAFVLQPAQCNTIGAGQYCTEGVTFTPNGTGPFSAVITVTDNSGNVTGSQQQMNVGGTGVSAAPLASATPSTLTFSAEDVGTTSAAQAVTLNNAGKEALNISSIAVGGAAAASFGMVSSGSSPCPAGGGTVAAGGSCTVGVTFTPQTSGTLGAALQFSDDASNGATQSVTLTGQGTSSTTATLTPPSVAFAAQSVGTTSAAIPVALANTGNSPLTGISIGVTPAGTRDFAESSNCGASLGAQSSCTIEVTFSPGQTGNRTGSISVADSAAGSPQTVSLSGSGTQAAMSLAPSSYSFAGQLSGTASTPEAFTATNTGSGNLLISKIGFSGANPGDFTETDNCAGIVPVNIPPQGTCAIHVTFNPVVTPNGNATRTATMTLTDNVAGSAASVALGGAATDFELGDPPAQGGTTLTVTAGQTAQFSLQINSTAGFPGTTPVSVALSCTATIPEGTCTTPGSVQVTQAASDPTFTVSVTTTAASGMPPGGPIGGPHAGIYFAPMAGLAMGMALLLFAGGRREGLRATWGTRRMRFAARMVQACILAAALSAGLAACGGSGGGSTGGGDPGTPANTYSLTVTATANGTSREIPLTLVVQAQ